MIPVETALGHIFALLPEVGTERVALTEASGRVLAAPVTATRAHPPFRSAVMDGYAIRADEAQVGAAFRVIGEAPAGRAWDGRIGPGEAVRIFTGAPLPEGASHVVMQEDTAREGDRITLTDKLDPKPNLREIGTDFAPGDLLDAPRVLTPADLALIAAMNVAEVTVRRRPVVAILSTGDELVMPGGAPRADQIIASNGIGLKAMVERDGGEARLLPIAGDNAESLSAALSLAEGADLLLTVGGASVGDHDLLGQKSSEFGIEREFYKVAVRPGKPLMAGRFGEMPMIGLPGNPVSALVCAQVFVMPALRAMLGLGRRQIPRETAILTEPLRPNGNREHYMRAVHTGPNVRPMANQDSALLTILSQANALIVRPIGDPARTPGDVVEVVPF